MTERKTLDLKTLRTAVAGDAAAFRCVTDLQPAGGTGDKVFPPTYEGGTYAFEERVLDGQRVRCVLLDSVQSQANRLELALLDGHRRKKLLFPMVQIDFTKADEEEVRAAGILTALEAPHRLADALFGASEVEERGKRTPFRHRDPQKASSHGRRFEQASISTATSLFELCPTALVFGMWDSHGPRRGLGEKFQRALVSEIIGIDAESGVRPTSRIDPVIRTTKDIPVERTSDGWRIVDKGRMKLSEVGLGNVTPTFEGNHGGVTFRLARQVTLLSLPALRRLMFPLEGRPEDEAANVAARTALAALGLAAISWQWQAGFDLRSRCLLVPAHELRVELLSTGTAEVLALTPDRAATLLQEAAKAAEASGLKWEREPITLYPGKELVKAVQKSRQLAAAEPPQ